MKYELLSGQSVDIEKMPRADLAFLLDLQRRASDGDDYFSLERAIRATDAYPLKGSDRVTVVIERSMLFRVADDIVRRQGIRQGVMAPSNGELVAEELISVSEAAEILGISRSGVVKAVQAGRLKGKKIANTWALLRQSVENYQVARHRVEAGRAAHRK